MPPELTPEFKAAVWSRMAAFPRLPAPGDALVPAAVAVALLANRKGTPCFLLTRRAAHLPRNAHQWALPGGRLEAGESAQAAALRELEEEVGLSPQYVEVAGALDDYVARSGHLITPVVVLVSGSRRLEPDPNEVSAVYLVPFTRLLAPGTPVLGELDGEPRLRLRLLGRLINPPTAAILYQLSEVVGHGRPTRVAQFLQPRFTWT